MGEKKQNIHKGHREKVRKRYIESGFKGVAEHNVLELMLFYGIAVRDTNPIAHALIDEFGSFSQVLQASEDELFEVKNMTKTAACFLNMILPLHQRYMQRLYENQEQLTSHNEIFDYMTTHYDLSIDKVYALYFDFNHSLIKCITLFQGDVEDNEFEIKDLAVAAIQTKAASVVLVHTHFNGLAKPSKKDVALTKAAYKILQNIEVYLENHIIISKSNSFSMLNRSEYCYIFNGFNSPII